MLIAPLMQAPDSESACIITAASECQARPTEFSRHGDTQPACFDHRLVKIVGKTLHDPLEPVLVRKARTMLEMAPGCLLICGE